jgi:hypothetical protein
MKRSSVAIPTIDPRQRTHMDAFTCENCQASSSLHAVVNAGCVHGDFLCPNCHTPMIAPEIHRYVWKKPPFESSGDVVTDCVRLLREWDETAPVRVGDWTDQHILHWWWCVNRREGLEIRHRQRTVQIPMNGFVAWNDGQYHPSLVVGTDGTIIPPTPEQEARAPLSELRAILVFTLGYYPIDEVQA